jgi:hypothetical protein
MTELQKLRRKHSLLNDAQGAPLDPRAVGKALLSDPQGSVRKITPESQAELIGRIQKNLEALTQFAERLPHGSQHQRSLLKYIAELRVEVKNRQQFVR